jgi:hypothetical protein
MNNKEWTKEDFEYILVVYTEKGVGIKSRTIGRSLSWSKKEPEILKSDRWSEWSVQFCLNAEVFRQSRSRNSMVSKAEIE